jgi:2-oxoglutarate dehydrogenase E1 component
MADLPGYRVGGTLHILVNNLLGFTAKPTELHSARFSSDVAKRLEIPIWHVNGEDPEAILRVGRMALEYRNRFQSDVVIDLIGYRRYGHSEVEDPTTTSPVLYKVIEERPVLWELYAKRLGRDTESLEDIVNETNQRLDEAQEAGRKHSKRPVLSTMPAYWDPYVGGRDDSSLEAETAVTRERLLRVTEAITRVPEGFAIHPKLSKLLERRREMGRGARPLDFGMAEALAFGSLLQEGYLVRLSGEDSRRGTFNHRNAVLFDTTTGQEYIPLHHLDAEQGHFDIVDSPLSEAAVLAYEYGFSRDTPDGLVCWEAQFGDFANGAQIIFDQFIAAAEDKWGLLSGLVVMLPHGFEGQGPEHSSARIERFLQLAAEDNLQICQPSNAAQLFHLLRRQVLQRWRKPLVIFTPKGLLRAKQASSELSELTSGGFCKVLTEPEIEDAQRIILCSGKIAHELRAERERRKDAQTTIICLAQLYPLPEDELYAELQRHRSARKVVWVQEEPANMGALSYVKPELARLVGDRHVTSVKRSASASPATGSSKAHRLEQEALIQLAFA